MKPIKTLLGNPRKIAIEHPRIPRSKKTQQSTDRLADQLVDKFSSPSFRPLFLKAAWKLDGATIERYVVDAFELGKNPRAYFISLVKRDKRYYE